MSHHVTHAAVSAWIAAYLHAWETYDPAAIGELFTEDAEYRWHPADEPEVGREAIVHAWLNPGGNASSRDMPGTYAGDLEPRHLRQHQVEQHEVRLLGTKQLEGHAAVAGLQSPEPICLERLRQGLAERRLVLHDEDRLRHAPESTDDC